MTSTEIRIALAEFDGWKRVAPYKCGNTRVDWPVFEKGGMRASIVSNTLPNYPNDLNAVHELEKKLNEVQKTVYGETLVKVEIVDWGYYPGEAEINWNSICDLLSATASQRCEALLRTLNLWRD